LVADRVVVDSLAVVEVEVLVLARLETPLTLLATLLLKGA
jgi:hypothetical protein